MGHAFKYTFRTALALSVSLLATQAFAKSDITVAMQLEPPHLDPTSAAAQAIDSVVYTNVFEGLTRFMGGRLYRGRAWRKAGKFRMTARSIPSSCRMAWTFHDGTTMDAEDVKFSLDRARAERQRQRAKRPCLPGSPMSRLSTR